MKQTRKKFYLYSVILFLIFGSCLNIFYSYIIWQTNKGYLESSYHMLIQIHQNRTEDIVNNAITEIDQQRQVLEKEYQSQFHYIVTLLERVAGDETMGWIEKLESEFSYCSFVVWDQSSQKLAYASEAVTASSYAAFLNMLEDQVAADKVETEKYVIGVYISKNVIESEVTESIRKLFHSYTFDSEGYIWVNKVIDFNGGDDYAIRLIHPNLIETEGQLLSTNTQDIAGNYPYLEELNGIKKEGEALFNYYFKKKNSEETAHKMTYAKLYPDYNWIVATGVYLDDMENFVNNENEKNQSDVWIRFLINLQIMIGFTALMTVSMYLLERYYTKRSLQKYSQVRKEYKELQYIAFQDPLTQLYNRRSMIDFLTSGFDEFQNHHVQISVVMGDIDDFKEINDLYGHEVGDQVIMEVSKILQSSLRSSDAACRWGGEEFLLALKKVGLEEARRITERMREEIENTEMNINGLNLHVTCSFGISKFNEEDECYIPSVSRADHALYQSKKIGKNRTTVDRPDLQ